MKKKTIIIVSIFVIILLGSYLVFDNTISLEKRLPNVDYSSSSLAKAYKIEETDNTIKLTVYSEVPLKQVTNFHFNNNILDQITIERHYETKFEARFYLKSDESFEKATRDKNVLKGVARNKSDIGRSKEDILDSLMITFKDSTRLE